MKYIQKFIFIFTIMLSVILIGSVKADTVSVTSSWTDISYDSNTGVEVKDLYINVTGDATGYNVLDTVLTLKNVVLTSFDLSPTWYSTKQSDTQYILETTEKGLTTGSTKIGRFIFTKILKAENCEVKSLLNVEKKDRTCSVFQGIYYGKSGLKVDELTYKKECEKPTCYKYDDGTFSNSAGEIVDEITYKKDCEKTTCNKFEDGTFSNSAGEIVDELAYKKDCEKPVCTKFEDGTYSDEKGNIVTKEEFESACTNPPTGSFIPYVITFSGCLSLVGIIIFTRNKTKMYKV